MVGGKRSKINTRHAPNASKISKHVCISFFYGTQKIFEECIDFNFMDKKIKENNKGFFRCTTLRKEHLNNFQKDKNVF